MASSSRPAVDKNTAKKAVDKSVSPAMKAVESKSPAKTEDKSLTSAKKSGSTAGTPKPKSSSSKRETPKSSPRPPLPLDQKAIGILVTHNSAMMLNCQRYYKSGDFKVVLPAHRVEVCVDKLDDKVRADLIEKGVNITPENYTRLRYGHLSALKSIIEIVANQVNKIPLATRQTLTAYCCLEFNLCYTQTNVCTAKYFLEELQRKCNFGAIKIITLTGNGNPEKHEMIVLEPEAKEAGITVLTEIGEEKPAEVAKRRLLNIYEYARPPLRVRATSTDSDGGDTPTPRSYAPYTPGSTPGGTPLGTTPRTPAKTGSNAPTPTSGASTPLGMPTLTKSASAPGEVTVPASSVVTSETPVPAKSGTVTTPPLESPVPAKSAPTVVTSPNPGLSIVTDGSLSLAPRPMLTRSSSTGTGRPLVLTPQKFPPVSPATGVPPLAKRLSFGAPLTIQVPSRPGPGTPNPNKPPLSIAIPETPTSSVSPATGTATPTATPGKTVPYSSLTRSASASLFAVTAHNLKITTGAPHFFRRDSSDQATPSSCSSVSRGQPLFTPASSTGGLPTPASPGDSAEPLTPITPGSAR